MKKLNEKYYIVSCQNEDCGIEFTIKRSTYNERIRNNTPMLCKDCMKLHVNKIQSKVQKEVWDNRSESDIDEWKKLRQDGIDHMSLEEKQIASMNKSNGQKRRYTNPKEREKMRKKSNNFYHNLSYEDHVKHDLEYCKNHNNTAPKLLEKFIKECLDNIYDSEADFMRLLLKYDIKFLFQIYNLTSHPNIRKLFPYNIQTGSDYVCPFHRWDFMIITEKENIFVDIDGSIHDPKQTNYYKKCLTGNCTLLSDIENFYDSQRIYQTDNLPAYIIQCYDNKLTLNSPVRNIYNNTNIFTVETLLKSL